MKSKKLSLVCCICTIIFLFSLIIGQPAPARADVNNGTLLVQQALQQAQNPYQELCMNLAQAIGENMICQMAPPNNDAGIKGCLQPGENCTGNDVESLLNQYNNLTNFPQHGVNAAQVGPYFIMNMPCQNPNQLNCGGYVIQWMNGQEIRLSQIGEAVENQLHDECANDYDAVMAVTQNIINNPDNIPEAGIVANIANGQAANFSYSMGRIAAYGENVGMIWDLQGFLQDNGNFFAIDPMAVTQEPENQRICFHHWTCALGTVVANQHDIDPPDCN